MSMAVLTVVEQFNVKNTEKVGVEQTDSQGRNFRKAMQQGRQLFFLPWGASIRDTYPEHRVEHMDALNIQSAEQTKKSHLIS